MTDTSRPPLWWSIERGKEWLRSRLSGGATCPLCGQHAEEYRRKITASMVATMGRMQLAIVHERPSTYVHLADIRQTSRDTATLQYWGLISEHPMKRGWWRVTERGREFLAGRVRVHKYAHVYNGQHSGFSGEQVNVHDVAPRFSLDAIRQEAQ